MENNNATAEAVPGTPQELRRELSRYKDRAHILSVLGQTTIDRFPFGLQPSIRTVQINPDPNGKEVYEPLDRKGMLRLTNIGLEKLAQAAGIQHVRSVRIDDRQDPFLCEYQVEVKMLDMDGSWRTVIASRTSDLREGSAETAALKNGIHRARQNIAAICESKARNRCMRPILGVQAEYPAQELNKPFIVVRMVPDTRDQDVKRMLLASQLGLEKYLFAALPTATAPEGQQMLPAPHNNTPPPVMMLPTGDIDIDDVPEYPIDGEPNVSHTDLPITPEDAAAVTGTAENIYDKVKFTAQERKSCIGRIEGLYKSQNLTRGDDKKKLADLTDGELLQVQNYMLQKYQPGRPCGEL